MPRSQLEARAVALGAGWCERGRQSGGDKRTDDGGAHSEFLASGKCASRVVLKSDEHPPRRNRCLFSHDALQSSRHFAELADFARTVAEEVLARLDAAERLHSNEPVIATGALVVNLPTHEAVIDGAPVKLKTREFALLAALAQNLGRVLTRDQLLELAWPEPEGVEENRTVDVHIRRVRVASGPAASLIETVHGIGYKLVKAPHPPAIEV